MNVPRAKLISLLEHYLSWHYGQAYKDIYGVWTNFLWFCFNFFSISELFGSLLKPWRRMGEDYPKVFDFKMILQILVVNILMRIVGAVVRLLVITIGLTFASLVFLIGLVLLGIWTIMPIFIVALIVIGLSLIIHG
ncbi:MAG: hypothetical protein WCT49_02505 [Candidatus Paceibacterota bacterium]|jgi:hypothetical protein|nr:hypothetical protein [Candidatus Paceibacterota bacterium]